MAQQQQQQPMNPWYPNYGPVKEAHHVTRVHYPHIDNSILPPLGHKTEASAREYARSLSTQGRMLVEVVAPVTLGGKFITAYEDGQERSDVNL